MRKRGDHWSDVHMHVCACLQSSIEMHLQQHATVGTQEDSSCSLVHSQQDEIHFEC